MPVRTVHVVMIIYVDRVGRHLSRRLLYGRHNMSELRSAWSWQCYGTTSSQVYLCHISWSYQFRISSIQSMAKSRQSWICVCGVIWWSLLGCKDGICISILSTSLISKQPILVFEILLINLLVYNILYYSCVSARVALCINILCIAVVYVHLLTPLPLVRLCQLLGLESWFVRWRYPSTYQIQVQCVVCLWPALLEFQNHLQPGSF